MNIFRIIASGKHGFREEFASAFLAYLLSPKMDHGLGYAFISRLLGHVAAVGGIDEIQKVASRMKSSLRENVLNPVGDDTAVELEFGFGNGFVDIVIRCGDWFIMIENKIVEASRKTGQIRAQYEGLVSTLKTQEQYKGSRILVLYLVPATSYGENWTVSPSFKDELEKVHLRDGDRKALVSWQPVTGEEVPIPSIVEVIRDILRSESQGTVPPIGTEVRHTLLSLVDFTLGEFQGFYYEGATAKRPTGMKMKVRDVLKLLDAKLYIGIQYGKYGTASRAWRDPSFLDYEVLATEESNHGWQYLPLKTFQILTKWCLNPEANSLEGIEWSGPQLDNASIYRAGKFGKTSEMFVGIRGGMKALKALPPEQAKQRIFQLNSSQKSKDWIPVADFSAALEEMGVRFD